MTWKSNSTKFLTSLLPSDINNPSFRRADETEIESVRKAIALESEDIVFCIEAETSSSIIKLNFFVVAEGVSFREGKVFYYERDNLNPGERIAGWVKRSS